MKTGFLKNAMSNGIEHAANKTSYQPVPDGRFYTKANFFTLKDRRDEGLVSSGDEEMQTPINPDISIDVSN